MPEKTPECYIDVWRDADFGGETRRLYGPAEFPTLRFADADWGDDIGSLRVGPNAFVMAYRDRDFKDELKTFGPNDEIADLRALGVGDDLDSLRLIDSLKIFDRVPYNAAAAPPPAKDAPAPPGAAHKPGRPRGKNRRGRGR